MGSCASKPATRERQPSCPFCQLAAGDHKKRTSEVLHKDSELIAFADISPAAFRHFLVIPVEHIENTETLTSNVNDYALLKRMMAVGQELLRRSAPDCEYRFGFHKPPFNSINHLHLHCLALPFKPRWRAFKYIPSSKYGWFVEADTLCKQLWPDNNSSSQPHTARAKSTV